MRHRIRAFTLIEVVSVVGILAVLAALFFPAARSLWPRVERVVCVNKLRNLHTVFSSYATEGWPQIPAGIALGSLEEQRWWVEKTKSDHGLSSKDWRCPTIVREMRQVPEVDRPFIHYLPTPFSAEPNRANKSPHMPWLIEIGNAHGDGNLMLLQSGTIKSSRE